MRDKNSISIRTGSDISVLSLKDTTLSLHVPNKPSTEIPHRNILNANFDTETRLVKVFYLFKLKKRHPAKLITVEGAIEEADISTAHVSKWIDSLMDAAYDGISRSRHLLIFVNPYGGTKQGASVFVKTVQPIFKAAGCTMKVIYTTRHNHAHDIVKSLSLKYDVIVTVSGDGLVHEILNGFAQHADPTRAFALPVAPIPTGSGNGLSLNLLGLEEGLDVCMAALNVIKGKPMKVDLFSFVQGKTRAISFMSQSLGLMADLDIGTDHLRWMGDARFIYGFFRGLIQMKACPVQLSYKPAESDKQKMADDLHLRTKGFAPEMNTGQSPSENWANGSPPLKYPENDTDGWTTFNEPILYVFAGKGPYVSHDLMAFPVSLPDDGLIDITITSNSSRSVMIDLMNGAKHGSNFWHPKLQYLKANAYRIKPLKNNGHLSVDGEPYPLEGFQVEVHQRLGTFLSMHGHYISTFEPLAPRRE